MSREGAGDVPVVVWVGLGALVGAGAACLALWIYAIRAARER